MLKRNTAACGCLFFEDLIRYGQISVSSEYPMLAEGRYVMNPSPIPRYDNFKLNGSDTLYLFGAGREKRSMPYRRIQTWSPCVLKM